MLADDELVLKPGKYREPLVLSGLIGTQVRLITMQPLGDEVPIFTSDWSWETRN